MADLAGAEARLVGGVPIAARRGFGSSFGNLLVRRPGYLFSPAVDFFCLGGGSLVAMVILWLMLPQADQLKGPIGLIALVVAHLITTLTSRIHIRSSTAISAASCWAPNTHGRSDCGMRSRDCSFRRHSADCWRPASC